MNDLTRSSFEGSIGSDRNDEQIFTVRVKYSPVYESGLLTTLDKELTNDLPPPLGGSGSTSIDVIYENATVTEIIELDQEGGRSVGRRVDLSLLGQEVTQELLDRDGGILFSRSDVANIRSQSL